MERKNYLNIIKKYYKINKKTYLKGLKNNLVLFNIILILLYL